MNTTIPRQMASLGEELTQNQAALQAELKEFPSGGAVLDVRRPDGRLLVMGYSPSQGFGVDEPDRDDGLSSSYRFTFPDFSSAAARLRELITPAHRPTVSKLSLVVLYCSDLAVTREFFTCLGLNLQREQHGSGPEHYSVVLGETVLELYPCSERRRPGGGRLGLAVSSLDGAVEQVRRCFPGLRIVSGPQPTPWGRRAVIEGPDAVPIELTELAG